MHRHILIYGHDSILLRTRKLLLEGAGFDVCASDALDEVQRIFAAWPVDLLILCHTVRSEERARILDVVDISHKNLAILFLVADFQSPAVAASETVFSTLDGPGGFVQTVCRLTHEPAPSPFVSKSSHTGQKLCHDSQAR
jgi:hypothetical protein